ncbi:MAG: hypothetical protein GXP51_06115, partial [Deltaproteobacteria bacterium]|nr:hypothetical protein [Deltaproteobacteria bacterium]
MVRFSLWFLCLFFMPIPAVAFDLPGGTELHGFFDLRGGSRLPDDAYQRNTSLLESRLQLEYNYQGDAVLLQLRGDFVADGIID